MVRAGFLGGRWGNCPLAEGSYFVKSYQLLAAIALCFSREASGAAHPTDQAKQSWKRQGDLGVFLHKDAWDKWNRTRGTTEILGIDLNLGKNLYNGQSLTDSFSPLINNSHRSVLET